MSKPYEIGSSELPMPTETFGKVVHVKTCENILVLRGSKKVLHVCHDVV